MASDEDHEAFAPAPDAPAVLGDRYELGPVLAHGGTATVYRARDRILERNVAVKLFAQGVVGPDRRRHDYEVRALAHLNHPGLVALYDAGTHDGRTYLVMQLVEGQTLAERLGGGPLSPETTIALGAALADSIAYVHDRGMVHRDLKPANVLLDAEGHPLIADFGIARLVDATRVTATGYMVGTAAYLSPEQVRGESVGPAADVFALGLVLLECITGRREYPGGALEAAVARLHRPPAIPDGLPEPLAALLPRMTGSDPAQRPAAAAVADILQGATTASSTADLAAVDPLAVAPLAAPTATMVGAGIDPVETPAAVAPEPLTWPPVRRGRRKLPLPTIGAAGALLVAVLTVLALRGPAEVTADFPSQAPAPAPASPAQPVTQQQREAPAETLITADEEPVAGGGTPAPALPSAVGPPPTSRETSRPTSRPTSTAPTSTAPTSTAPTATPTEERTTTDAEA